MASFFNRPSYTPSWQQRIYPVREPSFAAAAPAPDPAAPPRDAPPPVYFPGPNRRRSTHDSSSAAEHVPPGHIPSINTASTASCVVKWAYHPAAPDAVGGKGTWARRLRLGEIWRALRAEREVVWDRWPRELGGDEPAPWETEREAQASAHARDDDERDVEAQGQVSRRRSTRSTISLAQLRRSTTADSGVALTPRQSRSPTDADADVDASSHPLVPLFRRKIADLNQVIADALVLTRVWLALVELMDYTWIVALVIALAQGKGQQTGFLKGVEVRPLLRAPPSPLLIARIDGADRPRPRHPPERTRHQRRPHAALHALDPAARAHARLVPAAHHLVHQRAAHEELPRRRRREGPDGEYGAQGGSRPALEAEGNRGASPQCFLDSVASRIQGGELMDAIHATRTQGGYWLAYRPVIRCELVIPSSYSYHALQHQQLLAAAAAGQAAATDDAEGSAVPGGGVGAEPPRYEDA